jgi:hypothetical protein
MPQNYIKEMKKANEPVIYFSVTVSSGWKYL